MITNMDLALAAYFLRLLKKYYVETYPDKRCPIVELEELTPADRLIFAKALKKTVEASLRI